MPNKKSIGLLIETLKNGGAERAVANLSKDLYERYNVYIILLDANDIAYPYCGKIIDLNIKQNKTKNIFKRFLYTFKSVKELKRIKRKLNINIIISFMTIANRLNVMSKRKNDISIISIRNTMSRTKMNFIKRKLLVWCGQKADYTISLSEGVKNDLIENFNYPSDKIQTIYNSCSFNWFYKESKAIDDLIAKFDFSKPSLVTVGRLTYQKGQWHLLRAISIVKKTLPNIQLFIFGQGELKNKLLEYAKILGIQDNVFWLGYINNHHKFLTNCDLFVLPSIYEGLGNVLLESIACGLPTISMDCPNGPREILSNSPIKSLDKVDYSDYGVLVPPFTSGDFCLNGDFENSDYLLGEAIINLLSFDDLRDRYHKNALERIKDFSPEVIKQQWFDLLESLEKD